MELAERHLDWPMPGYTHLQRAQPVYLAHHLLAYFGMFRRDARRFDSCSGRPTTCRSGAGALAGVNFAIDRGVPGARARLRVGRRNSIDAVSDRDFVLDFLSAAATATHLSRLGAEIVLWSSEEFGFCACPTPGPRARSIMPQKKNPDAPSCCAPRPRASSRGWWGCTAC